MCTIGPNLIRLYRQKLLHFRDLNCAMAGEEGFEPTTYGFGDRHSNQLSYSPSAEADIQRPPRR